MQADSIAYQLSLCAYVLDKNTADLSQEDSLERPENGGGVLRRIAGKPGVIKPPST
jgi:hypothetical protein